MKTKILSTIALVAMIWGGGAVRYSPAQTRSENDLYNRTPIGTKGLVSATAYNASAASGIAASQQR